jgi:hypothetical protein
VTYVDAHDNEILYDALAFKLPAGTSPDDRARMQVLALATTVLGQGVGVPRGRVRRLRSKSLDRNSFNSGDWFNAITGTAATATGSARAAAGRRQPRQVAVRATAAGRPGAGAVVRDGRRRRGRVRRLLRIRASSSAFGWPRRAEVQRRVAFPLSGPDETPGVITMVLTGDAFARGGVQRDPRRRHADRAVVAGAAPWPCTRCRRAGRTRWSGRQRSTRRPAR